MLSSRDRLFSPTELEPTAFAFTQAVVDVFPDMIYRSVPGYRQILKGIERIVSYTVNRPGSLIYDLGCSLGATTRAVTRGLSVNNCHIIAMDNSEAMVLACKDRCAQLRGEFTIEVVCASVESALLAPCALIILNFTLQFLPISLRDKLLQTIHDALLPGGMLILSEKFSFPRHRAQSLLELLHHEFKRTHGYSEHEIAQKRAALENVLLPETQATHVMRLQAAGFHEVTPWFQWFNFGSIFAYKGAETEASSA